MVTTGFKLAAEALGTLFLVMGIVGAGIAGTSLSGGDPAMTLLAVSLAAGAMLFVWINVLGHLSGGHFNPAVTLGFCISGELKWSDGVAYWVAQIIGGAIGAILANLMFGLAIAEIATTERSGIAVLASELIGTFGLALLVLCLAKRNPGVIAPSVAVYLVAAHWFTGSGAFVNPAVTIARTLSDTFAGIAPSSVPAFVIVQLVGGGLAAVVAGAIARADN